MLEPQPLIFFGAVQARRARASRREALVQALYTVDLVGDTLTQVGFAYGDHGYYPTLEPPDHNGIEDATEIWWDPEEVSIDEIGRDGPGSYMYVDGGRRFLPGTWEEGERAFDPGGRRVRLRGAARGRGRSRTSIRPAADRSSGRMGCGGFPPTSATHPPAARTLRTSG